MKIKLIILSAIALIISGDAFAQKDVIQILISGKKIGEAPITESPSSISVNKMKYKKISDLTLIIKQSGVNKVYKRTLQITDENENQLFTINEQRSKVGLYKINLTKMREQLLKQNMLKVFLAEDPANEMMNLPSKRKLLAELHLR
ncbi:MAG: hypothetical protein ACR2KX_02285 [Chitinophagaceae bacterium]